MPPRDLSCAKRQVPIRNQHDTPPVRKRGRHFEFFPRDLLIYDHASANRYNSFTFKQFGNGSTLDNGFLVVSKIGRLAVRWSRPMEGTPKTVTISREADGW